MMVKQVKVSNFAEVKGIVSAAAKCYNDVGVHDVKGSIADAKSILGMMSLDYSHPVKIVCENEQDLNHVIRALKQEKLTKLKNQSAPPAGSAGRGRAGVGVTVQILHLVDIFCRHNGNAGSGNIRHNDLPDAYGCRHGNVL